MTTDGFYSRLIRFFTWSEYSHVALVLDNDTVIDADIDGGVKVRSYSKLISVASKWELVEVNLSYTTSKLEPLILETLIGSQVGKGYDYTALFGLLFRRDWQRVNKWFCSELITWGLGGIGLTVPAKANRVTPRHLYLFLQDRMEIIARS